MPYLGEDELEDVDYEEEPEEDEGLLELIEGDDEGWEKEAFGEARRPPRYKRKYTGRAGPFGRRPRPLRPVKGLTGGAIRTPAGTAQVRFAKPLATKESVDNLAKELRKEISLNAEAIKKVDKTVDTNTSTLDKKITAIDTTLKKGQQQSQQMSILPLLLTKPPQIESLTEAPPAGSPPGTLPTTVTIQNTTYKKDDSFFLIFAMMAMSGGLGGGMGDSSNMMMPLVLAMTLK
ncbi:MAG: hypothetical protein WBD99_10770 [Thermodesulfobacteriota bacterium]